METRFNAGVRQFFSWGGIAFRILDNMVRMYAIGVFISAATPLSLEMSVLLSGVIVVLYTMLGGLWAVVLTDLVQFILLMLTSLILVPLSLQAVGGLGPLTAALPEHFSFTNGPKGAPLFLLAYYVMVLIKYNSNWAFIQRFYSVRDERAAVRTAWLTALLFFLTPPFFLLPAIAARLIVPGLDNPEMAYAAVALQVLPPGIMGLMIASMFAATMSTVSAEFNVTAGVFTRDIFQRLVRPGASDRQLMFVARLTTVVIGAMIVTGAVFVGRFGGAFQANMILTGLAIPLAIPLVAGIVIRRVRPLGAVASVVIGVAVAFFLNAHPEVSWEAATLIVIAVSLAVLFFPTPGPAASADYRERVERFFRRLHTPVPERDKPVADPGFRRALVLLLSIAFGCTGILYVTMSLPSLAVLSGGLTLGAGVLCLAGAGVCYAYYRRTGRTAVPEPTAVADEPSGELYAGQPLRSPHK